MPAAADLKYEYGVVDQTGQLMGMPARTYSDLEAAQRTQALLVDRMDALKRAAEKAREGLASGVAYTGVGVAANDRVYLREMVDTYEKNKDNSYRVLRRQVGAWEPVT